MSLDYRPAARRLVGLAARASIGQRILRYCAAYGLMPDGAGAPPSTSTFPPAGPLQASAATIASLATVEGAPTEMSPDERGFLYALVRGAQPRRVLEIGTAEGGSSLVMATAMEDNGGEGHIWTIDPAPRLTFDPARYRGRVDVVTGTSPEAVDAIAAGAGAPFDLALIDGIHIHRQARADLLAVLPHLGEGAYVLLHDAFHFGVSEAIRELVEADERVHDCGYPCTRPRAVGDRATHGGFRLLRIGERAVDVRPLVAPLWEGLATPAPVLRSQVNHDFWYCTVIEACDYCREHGPDPLAAKLLGS